MRDFGKVAPQFWTGRTGRSLRGCLEGQVVALYLMTSPHATMTGVYSLPMLYLVHETGLTEEGAYKGLARCIEAGFCVYDAEAETVFVVNMASHQVGDVLKAGDKRGGAVRSQYRTISSPAIKAAFFDRYGVAFGLEAAENGSPSEGASEGAYKPPSPSLSPSPSLKAETTDSAGDPCPHAEIVALYHEILPTSPRVKVWTDKRRANLRTRWREDPKRQSIEYWRRFFEHVAASPFLTGRSATAGRDPFLAGLDWLVTSENFAKVIEGRYHPRVEP